MPPPTIILLLDLPPKTFVGIDLISFNSSPNLRGIINIPHGPHCLYTGTDPSLSIRQCRWLELGPFRQEVHVLQWKHELESLEPLDPSSNAFRAAVRSVPSLRSRGLVDYTALLDATSDLQIKQTGKVNTSSAGIISTAEAWPVISRYITTKTLDRILRSSQQNDGSGRTDWVLSSISSAPSDVENIPGLSSEEAAKVLHDDEASTINLLGIDLKQTWPSDSVGRDRTEKARDRSWYLGHLISLLGSKTSTVLGNGNGNRQSHDEMGDEDNNEDSGEEDDVVDRQAGARELLGELQFCFLTVLTLSNYSCLEQWKRILSVLFTCKAALRDVEGFFVQVVKVLHAQLERVEDVDGGLFEMGDEAGSAWLRALLKTFRGNVEEVFGKENSGMGKQGGLLAELSSLEMWLRDTYGWEDDSTVLRKGMLDLEDGDRVEVQMKGLDEDEETGEYAPVVVEM